MSTIAIDARMIGPTGHGIARYVQLMAKGLAKIRSQTGGLTYSPIFLVSPGFEKSQLPSEFETVQVTVPFLHPSELFYLPKVLNQVGADLYHSPSFSSLLKSSCPHLVTVHDLIHLKFGHLKEKVYYRALLRPFIKSAKAVVTVSESSREEISSWSGVELSQIDVVYNPIERPEILTGQVSVELERQILISRGLEKGKYFLCLSNAKAHKNMPMMIEAYESFRRQRSGGEVWPLVITARDLKAGPGVMALGALDDQTVQVLLRSASALFFPSLAEGFGRPPLEAAVVGVPIVVSRIAPHEEALRDLAGHEVLWEGARDFHGWVNAFHRVSSAELSPPSPESREKLLKRYSVDEMGVQMDRIYRRVLKSAP